MSVIVLLKDGRTATHAAVSPMWDDDRSQRDFVWQVAENGLLTIEQEPWSKPVTVGPNEPPMPLSRMERIPEAVYAPGEWISVRREMEDVTNTGRPSRYVLSATLAR